MGQETPLEEYASVAAWAEGLREQWGGDPLAEAPEKLAKLAEFCAFAGMDPDELVAFCFLRKRDTGQRFASVKRRQAMAEKLAEFCRAQGVSGLAARRLIADVLSFLIHNGVLMNPGAVRV